MEWLLILGLIAVLFAAWFFPLRRSLNILNENAQNAMGQIGTQLSSRREALLRLLDRMRDCGFQEGEALRSRLLKEGKPVTPCSGAEEVVAQQSMMDELLAQTAALLFSSPTLKNDSACRQYWEAADSFGRMIATSCLIYSDHVQALNHRLRFPPARLAGRLIKVRHRQNLCASNGILTVTKELL